MGLAVIADLGTMSAASEAVPVMLLGAREAVGVEARKTVPVGRARDGRRVGRDVNVLRNGQRAEQRDNRRVRGMHLLLRRHRDCDAVLVARDRAVIEEEASDLIVVGCGRGETRLPGEKVEWDQDLMWPPSRQICRVDFAAEAVVVVVVSWI